MTCGSRKRSERSEAVSCTGSFWQFCGADWQFHGRRLGDMQPSSSTAGPQGGGLYDIKPAFQARLAGVADRLTARGVHPDVLTLAGVACGLVGGAALAL